MMKKRLTRLGGRVFRARSNTPLSSLSTAQILNLDHQSCGQKKDFLFFQENQNIAKCGDCWNVQQLVSYNSTLSLFYYDASTVQHSNFQILFHYIYTSAPLHNLQFLRNKYYKELTLTFLTTSQSLFKAQNSERQNLPFTLQL